MSNPSHIRLKLDLLYEPRNDVDVSRVEKEVRRMLNHPTKKVSDIRLAPGHSAGALFLDLVEPKAMGEYGPVRWTQKDIKKLKREVVLWLEDSGYADDIRVTDTRFMVEDTRAKEDVASENPANVVLE